MPFRIILTYSRPRVNNYQLGMRTISNKRLLSNLYLHFSLIPSRNWYACVYTKSTITYRFEFDMKI